MQFDYANLIQQPKVNEIIDELANQKARTLAVKLVSENIVEKLSKPNDANQAKDELTSNDILSKMYLDSGKGIFDTNRLAAELLVDFEKTVTVVPDSVADSIVAKCNHFLDK